MKEKPLESILAESPIFQGLEPQYLELLSGCASSVRFVDGQHVFREGEEANHFYLLRGGHVEIEIAVPGHRSISIQTIGEGEVLGWSWLFPPYRWHFDARATETVHAISFDARCVREKLEKNPQLGYELMKRFARVIFERLQAARIQITGVYYGSREEP